MTPCLARSSKLVPMKMPAAGSACLSPHGRTSRIEEQITASGATWLDRQLLAREPATSGNAFGAEVREAMERRIDHLAEEGLARRQGQRVIFARDLLNTLRRQELTEAASRLAAETGLVHRARR